MDSYTYNGVTFRVGDKIRFNPDSKKIKIDNGLKLTEPKMNLMYSKKVHYIKKILPGPSSGLIRFETCDDSLNMYAFSWGVEKYGFELPDELFKM